MAPSKWDDEESDSTPPSSPPAPVATRRNKFEDEEDSDVLESWDAAEDSEEEAKKAAAAAAARAKIEEENKAKKKSLKQRIAEKEAARRAADEDESSEEESEDEATKRARLRLQEKEGDLKHAEDLFGGIGIPAARGNPKPVTLKDPNDPTKTLELSSLSIFNPTSLNDFTQLRETLVPLVVNNSKKSHYNGFATELCKSVVRDLTSEQVKKIASALTTLSNEKMRDEKAADKGTKKTKGAKKTTLNASRDTTLKADTTAYDDGLDEDDFM